MPSRACNQSSWQPRAAVSISRSCGPNVYYSYESARARDESLSAARPSFEFLRHYVCFHPERPAVTTKFTQVRWPAFKEPSKSVCWMAASAPAGK